MDDETAMTAAELRVARERMGLTAEVLAAELGVVLRTVRRWEHGHSAIPGGVARQVTQMLAAFSEFVEQVADQLDADTEPGEEVRVTTYAADETLRLNAPEAWYPASYHRAAMGEVQAITKARVRLDFVDAEGDD